MTTDFLKERELDGELEIKAVRSPLDEQPEDSCVDGEEWLDEPDEPDTPLVEKLIEIGEMVAIVGQSKAGKSFLALQLAVCAATGLPFLGRKTVAQNVYVANLEVSRKQYKKRLRRIRAALGIGKGGLAGRIFFDNLKGESASWSKCLKKCIDHDCKVAVIDPFYQIFDGDEVKAEDCKAAVEWMKKFQKHGITLIVVFHSPKGFNGDRQLIDMISGSAVLARFPESIIGLLNHGRDNECRVLKCILRNYAPPEGITIRYDGGQFVVCDDIEAVVESSERRAQSARKTPDERSAEAAQKLATALAYWGKAIAERYVGVSADAIKAEIVRQGGWSKTKANAIVYEIARNADDYGLKWDGDYGLFATA